MYMNDRRSLRAHQHGRMLHARINHGMPMRRSTNQCHALGVRYSAAWCMESPVALCTHKWHEHVVDLALQGPGSTSSAHGPSMRATHISLGVTWSYLGVTSNQPSPPSRGTGRAACAPQPRRAVGHSTLTMRSARGVAGARRPMQRGCAHASSGGLTWNDFGWRASSGDGAPVAVGGGTLAREWPNGAPDVSWQLCLTWCGIIWFMR